MKKKNTRSIANMRAHWISFYGTMETKRLRCTCTMLAFVFGAIPRYNKGHYYTSDSLWKIWLVESIQSIHNSLWTWHDKYNICCRYCIYHVKFNVCLVTKPLECSPQNQNGWTLHFCFWGWIMDFSILMYTLFRQRFYYCILKFLNDLG